MCSSDLINNQSSDVFIYYNALLSLLGVYIL